MNNSEKPAKGEFLDLDLPDWSGMDRFTPRVPAADAFRLNEEYCERHFSTAMVLEQWQKQEKCEVEFVL